MAKYPFLADAGDYLREYGFTLEQLADDPGMESIRKRAFERVTAAVDRGAVYKPSIESRDPQPVEVFSFLLAVVLLKMSGGQSLAKKFAMQEARGVEALLEKDLGQAHTNNQVIVVTKIIRDLSDMVVKKQEADYMVPVIEYLRRAVTFHAREWKLINRRVESGMVHLTPHQTVRLIRQEIVNYIIARISKTTTPPPISGLREFVKKLSEMEKRFMPKTPATPSGEFAPCIKQAILTLGGGDNLSHAGRFLLATYMLGRGRPIEEIVPYFKNAPDYKEDVTTYQIKHLSGEYGSGTAYRCQSCEKLKSLGLCHETPQCAGITNPQQFGAKP